MKTLILSVSAALLAVATFAAEATTPKAQLTPEQRVQRKRMLMLKRFGGYIDQKMPGSGKYVFVNAQTKVPTSAYEPQLAIISDAFAVEVSSSSVKEDVTFANAESVMKAAGGAASLFVVNHPNEPALLIAPEKGWAFVNVAALSTDNPSEEVLAKRVRREVWRGFAMSAGSTDTEWAQCLLNPITSLKALDTIDSEAVSPEPASKIAKHLTKLGILPFKRVPYKKACMEGWAPAPTNEFQKAVWDKVHEPPKNPMKIEFDPKKGR